MALSNLDKKHTDELLLAINQQNINHNAIEVLKSNYMNYGKLKQLAKQMEKLKQEAQDIMDDTFLQHTLQNVDCQCKKISGTTYHLYCDEEINKQYFSLVSPAEWNGKNKHSFLGSYYYDYDKTYVKVED